MWTFPPYTCKTTGMLIHSSVVVPDPHWSGCPGSRSVLRMRIRRRIQEHRNLPKLTNNPVFFAFRRYFLDLIPTFKYNFHVKILLFCFLKFDQDPDLDPHCFGFLDTGRIPISTEIKSGIRVRTETNTDPQHWYKGMVVGIYHGCDSGVALPLFRPKASPCGLVRCSPPQMGSYRRIQNFPANSDKKNSW